jgi:hypothetical protein
LIKATRLAISGVLLLVVMSGMADTLYKATDYHAPEGWRCVAWNDESLAITWPFTNYALGNLFRETGAFF